MRAIPICTHQILTGSPVRVCGLIVAMFNRPCVDQADEYLHRSICGQPRCFMERCAAACWGKNDGDHLRDVNMDCVLIGKTHMRADWDGIKRLGIAPDGIIGVRVRECGFDPTCGDDGMAVTGPDGHYDPEYGLDTAYNKYMWSKAIRAIIPGMTSLTVAWMRTETFSPGLNL